MIEHKWSMRKDLYKSHVDTFNCFLDNKLIHTHSSYEYILEYNKYLENEVERLNNIINELERFVKNCNEYNSKCNSTIYEARAFEDSIILHKIKELKGSSNNG